MPQIEISGVGKIEVSDDFLKLSPQAQHDTVEQIAASIRARGVADDISKPDYKSMSAVDVAKGFVTSIPHSAEELAKTTVHMVAHPVETAQNMYAIGKGVLQKSGVVSGAESEPYAEAAGKYFMDRYGSVEGIKRALATDPVGVAADVAMLLSGGGGLAARAGGIAGRVGEAVAATGRAVDPFNIAAAGVKGAGYAANVVTGGRFAPTATARADIARALQRDEMTAQQAQAAGQALAADRPGATLADVAGENTRGLVERVAQTPGAGRTIVVPELTARQEQQMGRIADDLSDLTGTKKSAFEAIDETIKQRAAEGKPAYDAAMNFNARADADIVQAWQEATSTGWGKQILNSGTLRRNIESEYGIRDINQAPLMVGIDAWKKVADDAIGAAMRGGDRNKARVISGVRDSVLDVVKQKNPAYSDALSKWAGRSQYLDAIESGKGILKSSADELAADFAKFGASQQEAFRIGAVSSIVARMGRDPAKLADLTKNLRSPEMRAKVKAIMPTPVAAAAWERRLDFEVGSSELVGRSLRGSQTARRQAEMSDAKSIVGDLVMGAFSHGGSVGLAHKLLSAVAKPVRDTLRSRTDKEIAKIVTSPQALQNLPATLQQRPVLPPLPYRGAARAAFQAGRISNNAGN